jgi:ribosomal protein L22
MSDEEKNENLEPVEGAEVEPAADAAVESAADAEVEETEADIVAEAATDEEDEAIDEVDGDEESEDEDESDDDEDEDEDEPEAQELEKPAAPKRARRSRTSNAEAIEEKPAAAPKRSRGGREPGAPRPVVRAQAKYVRSSARKARLVCDHIRGKSVDEARAILAHTPRAVARDWSKLLESAVANAEHNHELVGEDLFVKAVTADEGPTIKRFRPRAQGRATRIRKRTAHLTILLTPKD